MKGKHQSNSSAYTAMAATKFSHHQLLGAIFLLFLVLQPFAIKARPVKKLESLLKLEGAEKGDTVNGLNQVKQYLKSFGYYPNHDQNHDMINDDRFDESLESALKSYQQNFHLNVTGKIDHDTIKTMKTARCGVRDQISNGAAHNHTHYGNYKFNFVSKFAFFDGSPKWDKFFITYNFVTDFEVFTVSQLSPVIANAFQKWAAVSPFRFMQIAQDAIADVKIGFFRRDHGDGVPFEGRGGIGAHAFSPPDGRLHYDADEIWSLDPNITPDGQLDLFAFAVHEIGHNLGLAHSLDQNAIMYPTIPNGRRDLNQDDIDGLRALYGYP